MAGAFEILGNALLFLLVYGMSATVDTNSLLAQLTNVKALLTGAFLQFVLLPFLGFVVVKCLNLDYILGVMILVITSSPGGSFSNWWCSLFNADLALSVTMTAMSTILSVIFMPLNMVLYAKASFEADVVSLLDWPSLFEALFIVIAAIVLGLFTSAKVHSHRFNQIANTTGNVAGIALISLSGFMSNSDDDAQLWSRPPLFYIGIAAPCVLGLALANVISSYLNLRKPERITVSIECCYQNVGIASSIALSMFQGDDLAEAMGAPVFYGLVEAVVLGIYCVGAWKCGWSKAPANESFCTVISTSYEVLEAMEERKEAIEISLGEPGNKMPYTDIGDSSNNTTTWHYTFWMGGCCEGNSGIIEPEEIPVSKFEPPDVTNAVIA